MTERLKTANAVRAESCLNDFRLKLFFTKLLCVCFICSVPETLLVQIQEICFYYAGSHKLAAFSCLFVLKVFLTAARRKKAQNFDYS